MDVKKTGIVIRSSDYRENDKRLRILTPEGLIYATLRGVKKSGARLKPFAQLFVFAEFELVMTGQSYTVKTCAMTEDFFGLSADPDAYACACMCAEVSELSATAVDNSGLFLLFLKTLKTLCYDRETLPYLMAAKYIQKLLSLTGFYRAPSPPKEGSAASAAYLVSRCTAEELKSLEICERDAKRLLKSLLGEVEAVFEKQLVTPRALKL